jgi:hypothetical protein
MKWSNADTFSYHISPIYQYYHYFLDYNLITVTCIWSVVRAVPRVGSALVKLITAPPPVSNIILKKPNKSEKFTKVSTPL